MIKLFTSATMNVLLENIYVVQLVSLKYYKKQNALLSKENLSNTLCMVFQWWICERRVRNVPTLRINFFSRKI